MSRAGQWSRKSRAVRKVEVWNSVGKHTALKGYATITDVANDLKMTRSSHLRDMCLELAAANRIDVKMIRLIDGRESYQFYFSEDRLNHLIISCNLPWLCRNRRGDVIYGMCVIQDDNARRVCPVSYLCKEDYNALESTHKTLTPLDQQAIDKYHSPGPRINFMPTIKK